MVQTFHEAHIKSFHVHCSEPHATHVCSAVSNLSSVSHEIREVRVKTHLHAEVQYDRQFADLHETRSCWKFLSTFLPNFMKIRQNLHLLVLGDGRKD